MAPNTFDFVVVGGGPAGCAAAASLAKSSKRPSVLLLEAGSENADRDLRVNGQRFTTFMNPDLNWGYKTTPQTNCAGRELDYSRGLGLGGSSAINFGVYSTGARDDYEAWARIVDDNSFGWDRMHQRFKDLESFDPTLPANISAKYAAPKASDHGFSGPLKLGYASEFEDDFPHMLDVFEEAGWPLNPDHNSGNPIGMATVINSAQRGLRSTANDLLTPRPENLTIVTNAAVQRLIVEGAKIAGVETKEARYFASKEVVLAAGSLNSPSILMHSGIGPAKQLREFNIPVVRDIPAVGQNLRDHMFVPLVYQRTESSTSRASFYGNPQAMDAALEQWKKDGTGDWSKYSSELGIGWKKLEGLESSAEFQSLPPDEQSLLRKETVPHYEVITHFPVHYFIPHVAPDAHYSCFLVFYYNAQSRGEVTLQSSDPAVPLKFNPRFLGTAFDRHVAVRALREVLALAKTEAYAKDTTASLAVPASESDEDLLDYWRQNIGSSWHMTGTLRMGRPGDADAVVDNAFRLVGFEGLRVADMSVVPILPSCHVQAVAYVAGVACAEKLIAQYELS
ncbi:putative choline dehydrogenase [Rosellinia necatrix]|uniref:Putative choline dehydrogenase n=1 Tax=Rosellinia necatrix TaxID=77044 RepID=A0A1S7UM88_ROSNE|nr:putative choline dehydrogenase [Rosellinia necatrix]